MLKKNRRFGSVGPPNVFASKEISRVLPNVPLISEHFLRRIHSSSRNRFHQGHRTGYSAPDNTMPGERGVDDDEGDVMVMMMVIMMVMMMVMVVMMLMMMMKRRISD